MDGWVWTSLQAPLITARENGFQKILDHDNNERVIYPKIFHGWDITIALYKKDVTNHYPSLSFIWPDVNDLSIK